MTKFIRLILGIVISILAFNCYADNESNSTILGIADITLSSNNVPSFITESNNAIDYSSEVKLEQQLPNISSQIRNQISTNYPWIKVVSLDSTLSSTLNDGFNNESSNIDISKSNIDTTSGDQPNYYLIGQVSAINAFIEENLIENTNQYSQAYYVDIAVNFKLINPKEKKIIAEFVSAGQSGDAIFVNKPSKNDINIDQLQQAAINDLVTSTLNQINNLILSEKIKPVKPSVSDAATTSNTK